MDLAVEEHLEILGERQGICAKVACAIQKPAICLKGSSLEANLLQSDYRNSCTPYRFVTNWRPRVNFGLFPGATFATTDISHTFCRSATKYGSVRVLANRQLLTEVPELSSGVL